MLHANVINKSTTYTVASHFCSNETCLSNKSLHTYAEVEHKLPYSKLLSNVNFMQVSFLAYMLQLLFV